jgi:hypothetical protein
MWSRPPVRFLIRKPVKEVRCDWTVHLLHRGKELARSQGAQCSSSRRKVLGLHQPRCLPSHSPKPH